MHDRVAVELTPKTAALAERQVSAAAEQVTKAYQFAEHRREAPKPVQNTASTPWITVDHTIEPGDLAALIIDAWRRADKDAKQRVVCELREEIKDIDRSIDWLEIPAVLGEVKAP